MGPPIVNSMNKPQQDIMQQNRTLLLTDSLPCVQILRSAKTKDSTVYSLLVKLAGEYPNIMVNHCKGAHNISRNYWYGSQQLSLYNRQYQIHIMIGKNKSTVQRV